jgi:hypothetical protein
MISLNDQDCPPKTAKILYLVAVFRIRIGFNAGSDPSNYLDADPDLDPG